MERLKRWHWFRLHALSHGPDLEEELTGRSGGRYRVRADAFWDMEEWGSDLYVRVYAERGWRRRFPFKATGAEPGEDLPEVRPSGRCRVRGREPGGERKRRCACQPCCVKRHELGLIFGDFAPHPSGLLLPVELEAQHDPGPLPPDLPIARPAMPSYIRRQSVAPIDSIHSWIDQPQLGFEPTSLGDLIEGIRVLPFERGFRALAFLLRRLSVIARDPARQLELARVVYAGLPLVRSRLEAVVAKEPSRVVFAEPVLIPLLRLLIEEAADQGGSMSDDELELLFESIVLAAPSAIGSEERVLHGGSQGASLLAFFMRKSNFLRDRATLNGLVRQHMIFDLMRTPLDERAEVERCDVDSAMQEMFGLTTDEQLRLGFGVAAKLSLWDDDGEGVNLLRFPQKAFEDLLQSLGLSDVADAAMSLVSRTREQFRDAFHRLDPDRACLSSVYLPFQQTPFLRLSDGSLMLTSPRFVSDWLEDGFHYRALDAIAGRPRDTARSGRYLRFAGHVFERYCVRLATEVHRVAFAGHVKVLGDFACEGRNGERRTVDLMVFSGDDLVLFEIEHHRPGIPVSVRGDRIATEEDLRDHTVQLVTDLTEFIELLRSDHAPPIPGLDMRRIRRIWPVIVGVEVPAQQPPLWDFLDEDVVPRLVRTGAEPLTILDAEDFETLCGIVEGGKLLPTLLARKCARPYQRLELNTWLTDDPLAPRARRPRLLEAKYEALMNEIVAVLRRNA